ncbi:VPS10 domain-containing protein [Salinimicrobium soli]|uniref:VPS10 domain-containing protein n=1 Tax=Salinimicrobium soli TaxID=1254399 RepID=UPI003AAAEDA3
MKKTLLSFLFLLLGIQISFPQQPATSGEAVKKAVEQKDQLKKTSDVKNLPLQNIGPTIMSGRVVDFAVNPENSTEFYVAYATGGLWYTNNNGTTFTPVMDNAPTLNLGDIAVDWKNGTIWAGTGEVNASRSSYAGIGLLRSDDKGESWQFMGLPDSHHISRILINPNNPDEVVVGVLGHLYSENEERGVFRTTDGGKTWEKTLFIDPQTGIIDISVAPNDFNTMYAAAWERERKAWDFKGSGESSGIYKSTDAGKSWEKVSTPASGFPTGEGVGRIGLSAFNAETIYAVLDNQAHREKEKEEKKEGLQKEDFQDMSKAAFLKLSEEELGKFLKDNDFPEKYSAKKVREMVKDDEIKPADLALYLGNANEDLFDTPVIGAQVYKSTDGGKTWKKTHDDYLDDVYYSYGYYFGMIHVDPNDDKAIYIYGVPILKSKDGGKTFVSIDAENVHADHHALWIDPNMPGHLIDGNDGGVNISYDDGENWILNNNPAVGQFYSVNVDNEKPYNVYGGLQDNGVWVGPHLNEENASWQANGDYPFKRLMGGDGMQVEIDNRNSDIVYTGFQFGTYFRINRETGERTYIQPKHELGERPYRFNWQTPILLSPHNQDILYLGGNKLMRSMDQGNTWTAISDDLTEGGKPGNVPYGTLTSISESPFQFGLIYAGSDDGLVHVTTDGGGSWTKISDSLPKDLWVSRVIASEFEKDRVYLTLNGYRWDDFKPYVYVSEDKGKTWKDISGNLPLSPVNVIREDPNNEQVLYLGTDNGLYVSMDRGNSWAAFSTGLPEVPVHDLRIQKREKQLVVGTHGRSIYRADISPISDMKPEDLDKKIWVAPIAEVRFSPRWGNSYSKWMDPYMPKTEFVFYSAAAGKAKVTVKTKEGLVLREFEAEVEKGFNTVEYDLTISEAAAKKLPEEKQAKEKPASGKVYIPKGEYKVEIKLNSATGSQDLIIK